MKNFDFTGFRNDFNAMAKALGEQYNVDISIGNISYDDIHFTTRMTVKAREVNGESGEEAEFKKYARLFGVKPEAYKARFTRGGQTFELYGFNTRARSMPLKARDVKNGTGYKFTREAVLKVLPEQYKA